MERSNKRFTKYKKTDSVYWVMPDGEIGKMLFSFDKKTVYNLWTDFPDKLSADEVKTFCKENPRWAVFFAERLDNYGIGKS